LLGDLGDCSLARVASQFAATAQRRGVDIALLLDPMFDGDFNKSPST
jgi:hypothetical protein